MTLYVCNGKRRPFVRWREAENKSRSHRSTAAGRRDRSAGSWNGSSRRSSWRLGGGAAATATAAVAWRRMLRDFPLPLWRRPNAGRSILARQWLLRRRRRGICGGGVAVVGLLGCLAAFHSVSQLVSPSNLGSAYYYCSGAKGDSSKANLVNKQLQRKNLLCDEKSSLCCGFAYPKTTTCYYRVVRQ